MRARYVGLLLIKVLLKVGLPTSDLNASFCTLCLSVRSTFNVATYFRDLSADSLSCPAVVVLGLWDSPKGQSPSITEWGGKRATHSQIIVAVG